jgi:hypothetical protein
VLEPARSLRDEIVTMTLQVDRMRQYRQRMGTQMRRVCSMLLLLAASGNAGAEGCSSLNVAEWLVGEWHATSGDKRMVERWQKVSPETFEGMGTTSRAAKVVESEALRLVAMEQRVFYVAKVAQNPIPIAFTLMQCDGQKLVFENPAHDFPKKLEYQLTNPDTFTVRVSDGAQRGFTLTFSRQPR